MVLSKPYHPSVVLFLYGRVHKIFVHLPCFLCHTIITFSIDLLFLHRHFGSLLPFTLWVASFRRPFRVLACLVRLLGGTHLLIQSSFNFGNSFLAFSLVILFTSSTSTPLSLATSLQATSNSNGVFLPPFSAHKAGESVSSTR